MNGRVPVGLYGNGFKSGSMRLGKDAIVFTKNGETMSVGLLSQTFLEVTKAEHVMVPIVTFNNQHILSITYEQKFVYICKTWVMTSLKEISLPLQITFYPSYNLFRLMC